MGHRPIKVKLATEAEDEHIASWLQDPAIYHDAFMLASRPDPVWVRDRILHIQHAGGTQELATVRFWAVWNKSDELIGMAVDYPWEPGLEDVREIDVALPGSDGSELRLPLDVFAQLIHALFRDHGVEELRARARPGPSGEGFSRLFSRMGVVQMRKTHDPDPDTGDEITRILYGVDPSRFYASPMGKRLKAADAG